ncbi:MAG: crossover junction endodeoxyribonuclease RuvC [Holosporaceae bacterium]|nr:crossover junction endodeoxyribonuclease RuvC [Holosporaceae bacterium]
MSRILGIDPGLHITGWGMIDYDGFRLRYKSHGSIISHSSEDLGSRLSYIFKILSNIIEEHDPEEVSVEEVFVNKNPFSSLKLGMARGAAICCAGVFGLKIYEYTPNKVKKTIVGMGHASKEQVSIMVQKLLNCGNVKSDEADALAVAVCHAHHRTFYTVKE